MGRSLFGQVVRLEPPTLRPRRRADDADPPAQAAAGRATERWLVTRALDGEREAWDGLVALHALALWHRALSATGEDAAVAGGLCQLVWLRLAQSLPALGDERMSDALERLLDDALLDDALLDDALPTTVSDGFVPDQRRPVLHAVPSVVGTARAVRRWWTHVSSAGSPRSP
jgi:hypothetical protein